MNKVKAIRISDKIACEYVNFQRNSSFFIMYKTIAISIDIVWLKCMIHNRSVCLHY